MNLEQPICDRIIKTLLENGSKIKAELLKNCRLQLIVIENSSALLIRCPNSWTAEQINGLIVYKLGLILHSMGIEQAILNDGDGQSLRAYYQWDITNMVLKGYFVDGDLNKFIPIPSDEDLGIF
jgi:hypothetical protein